MQSAQERILAEVERVILADGLAAGVVTRWANSGAVFIYRKGSTMADGSVDYDFQDGTYKLSIKIKGKRIPSQPGRDDYFDFYQPYAKPTNFWAVLEEQLKFI